jgi:hypothetical protein
VRKEERDVVELRCRVHLHEGSHIYLRVPVLQDMKAALGPERSAACLGPFAGSPHNLRAARQSTALRRGGLSHNLHSRPLPQLCCGLGWSQHSLTR